ncbi:MAG: hypothetical protein QM572_18425 [Nocardioides sp.]|uniref:hypothetical protein n=1 Tax=Nocardioides sp. TaxID=35761 RepID=UPI0039E46E78
MGDHTTESMSPMSEADLALERIARQRSLGRTRHASALAKLLEEREDLSGVHALADLVSESLRWSA